jgi:hypothetical protein
MNTTDNMLHLGKENLDHYEDGQCHPDEEEYHSGLLAGELRINTDCEETRIVNDDEFCDTLCDAGKGLIINGFKNDTNGRFDGEEVIFHRELGKLAKASKPIQKQVIEYDVVHQGEVSKAVFQEDLHFSHGSAKALKEIQQDILGYRAQDP